MAEAKTVKKRSVGRPKKNKALQQLRVQTWFNAVAEASGKTAYELEKEFAPSTVDRENFNKQRARLWEKYRLGKTMPTIKEKKGGKKGIAQLVEEKYPGTLKVLEDPIWTLLSPNSVMTMDYIKNIYFSLGPDVRKLLVNEESNIFWRKSCEDFNDLLKLLSGSLSTDSFRALSCLLREALICQQKENFTSIIKCFKSMLQKKEVNKLTTDLSKIVVNQFTE